MSIIDYYNATNIPIPHKNDHYDRVMYILEEREAILEFDAGFTRKEAEQLAYKEVFTHIVKIL